MHFRYLLIATGLSNPNRPEFSGLKYSVGYEEIEKDGQAYEGKNVLILGK